MAFFRLKGAEVLPAPGPMLVKRRQQASGGRMMAMAAAAEPDGANFVRF